MRLLAESKRVMAASLTLTPKFALVTQQINHHVHYTGYYHGIQ